MNLKYLLTVLLLYNCNKYSKKLICIEKSYAPKSLQSVSPYDVVAGDTCPNHLTEFNDGQGLIRSNHFINCYYDTPGLEDPEPGLEMSQDSHEKRR